MERRSLGRTGLMVSALGFGCGSVGGLLVRGDATDQRRAIGRALDAGITYFDTAPSYGAGRSEENLGQALLELGAWDRVVVGTKVRLGPDDRADAAAAVGRSVEQSLRRLGRDHVDLLQLHNPVQMMEADSGGLSPAAVLGAVSAGLKAVVAAGLARHAGITGIGEAAALREVIASGSFATVQAYFNILNPSAGYAGAAGGGHNFDGLIDTAAEAGMGVLAIRVLAAGAASGSTERAPNASAPGAALVGGAEFEQDVARARGLADLATVAGLESTVELAVRFALSKPGISTVLTGISTIEQLADAIRWAERGPLPEPLLQQVAAAGR
ncbi:MAG: aldo/keto reductase [Dehalococcoidia bacterium]